MQLHQEQNLSDISHPIYTKVGHERTSKRFRTTDTHNVIEWLENQEGFTHVGTSVAKYRNPTHAGFQNHCSVFEREDLRVGDDKLQLYVYNNNLGRGSLSVNLGILRMLCLNGIVVGNQMFRWNVRHVGQRFQSKVIGAVEEAVQLAPTLGHKVEKMQNTYMSLDAHASFAYRAARLRLKPTDEINTYSVGKVRRVGDEGSDLWTTYNRLQEDTIRGGVEYSRKNAKGETITRTTRKVGAISTKMVLNRKLWNLAEDYINA